ncbi:ABC transporter permease [Streptomyces sp. TRM66268-LWL]|uniref:Transport permease protein n=1 Tax=Streptomyces polyasparticus TaxID=2767826 RepID=A0ABR7SRL9_9ACTN|nr:ABC transporter permease [Streptomyces polyasparticus]MBC9718156.1 ABC transporter permease [Streptomyces polyasparticus]
MSQVLEAPPERTATPPTPSAPSAQELAARYGLSVSNARPSLGSYASQLWQRRHFITAFATAKLTTQYSQAKLGQLWQVMTPLLNAAVYYLIFGVLMGVKRGVPDYIPFLVTGVFVFTFTQSSIMAGTRAVAGNLGLVRALHFPRAALPISFCLQQLQQLLFSMVALVVIVLGFGLPVTPRWLLVFPALVLQSVFNAGLAMIVARLCAKTPDIGQLMPFVLRTWMYVSGVMFSLQQVTKGKHVPHAVHFALEHNPATLFIDLMRYALIDSFHANQLPHHVWAWALGWALFVGIGGFVYFWKAEETYGRG